MAQSARESSGSAVRRAPRSLGPHHAVPPGGAAPEACGSGPGGPHSAGRSEPGRGVARCGCRGRRPSRHAASVPVFPCATPRPGAEVCGSGSLRPHRVGGRGSGRGVARCGCRGRRLSRHAAFVPVFPCASSRPGAEVCGSGSLRPHRVGGRGSGRGVARCGCRGRRLSRHAAFVPVFSCGAPPASSRPGAEVCGSGSLRPHRVGGRGSGRGVARCGCRGRRSPRHAPSVPVPSCAAPPATPRPEAEVSRRAARSA
ncbi:hypothetical protein SCANM124S_03758 [Streptomyces canus]